ncbi:hypothetical protein J4G33_14015 [Actinotalea sp. BY-33]|uniref:Uncharacterized protein n=1 Tax=Actinotalea soli TaxID=2819234 RepID=A0A939LRT1_9CELL|nr:DUF6584 family protein [Actinotalea soli]MBO1752924.1 hypothetical protein [Actinotalea soli]
MSTPDDGADGADLTPAERLRRRRQWLKQKVDAEPQRLDLREELAAVYRAEGHADQAGRWNYLSEDAEPAESEAFVRASQSDPVVMMRALCWTGSENDAETAVARERLGELRAAARGPLGRRPSWENPVRDSLWPFALGCVGVLVVLGFAMVGAIVTVRWLGEVL